MFKPGDVIDGKYKVDNKIGQGGFGVVLAVYSLVEHEYYALKYCNPTDEEQLRRFKREVRLMKSINHENVIRVIDFNLKGKVLYFCMPLAECSLRDMIPLDFSTCVDFFEQLCNGVNAIHLSGSTHRDIKPDNVLVMPDNRIVVSDLGLSKFDNRDSTVLTRPSVAIGTDIYMPPEQKVYGGTRDLEHTADVYMLGKTLYAMVTGREPYPIIYSNLSAGLKMVIRKATQENPQDRYQNVSNLLDAFLDSSRALTEVDKKGFKNVIKVATEKIRHGETVDDISLTIIDNIRNQEEDEELIEYFHELSNEVLRIIIIEHEDAFLELMKKYQYAIENVVEGYAFNFAEKVGKHMKDVMNNTASLEIKSKALIIMLIAAVRLNRFVVMDSFNKILINITDNDLAEYVAEELRTNIEAYEIIFNQVPRKVLHSSIAVVWDRCQ